jgi:hypothetical protein
LKTKCLLSAPSAVSALAADSDDDLSGCRVREKSSAAADTWAAAGAEDGLREHDDFISPDRIEIRFRIGNLSTVSVSEPLRSDCGHRKLSSKITQLFIRDRLIWDLHYECRSGFCRYVSAREEIDVASRVVLDISEAGRCLRPIPTQGSCDSTRTGTSSEGLSCNRDEMNMETSASVAGLGCVKGTTLALVVEAGAGLFIYGIWLVLHYFR